MQDPTPDDRPGEQPSPDISIAELGLPARARNVLVDAGINTVNDALAALEKGDETLTGLKGFGSKSLAALKKRLQEHGFSLPDETISPLQALGSILEQELLELEMAGAAPTEVEEEVPQEAPPVAEEAAPEDKPPVEAPAPAGEAPPTAEPLSETPSLSLGQRLRATLAQPREQFRFGAWIYGVIGILVIIALLLPPVSLLKRLGITGYTTLDAQNSSISHPDGVTLSVSHDTFTGRLRVRMESVPRLEFLEGSAGGALRKAVETLPDHLVVKSPLYQIKVRGDSPGPVMIDVVVPNDAEPWETLDLYTWTGNAWEWVGSELHTEVAEHEFIRARVTDIPTFLVVVQAGPLTPTVSTSLEPDDNPVAMAAGLLDEVNPTGLLLSTDGGFVVEPNSLLQPVVEAAYDVLPTLRNWAAGAPVNRGLLSDVLMMPEIQEAHIANIVQLCTEGSFAGVDVDYRGVGPDERDAYSDFIVALSDALHAAGLRLSVVVEPPTPTDGDWDTGGYDWAKLGAVADAIKVPFPDDPVAYVEGGQAQRLLDWATSQVDRYKLRMLVSSLSAEQSGSEVRHISLEQALAPFGEVIALDDVTQVESGSQVKFGLASQLLSIMPQEDAGTYRLEYETGSGETRTVWLGTATNLAAKLRWAERYNLGGVAVADMLDPGNGAAIVDAVAAYRTAAPPSIANQEMTVVWTVASAEVTVDQQTSPLTDPGYTWTVLSPTGDYTIKATIAGFDHGSVSVTVGEPEPVITEVITVTEKPAADEADEPTTAEDAVTAECLGASYVADVTIPDNTQLDNGEEFEKTWRVRNSGTCAWPENTVLAFAGQTQMGAPDSVEVGALEPGQEIDVSVTMKAPDEPGRYTGIWQMKTGDTFFGVKLSVVILAGDVAETSSSTITPVGGSFELGGHIRDTGFPYADKMRYAGMTWAKVQVHYGQDVSGLVAAAHARNFKIQLSALGTPSMVTQPGFEQDFANWTAQLAAAGADAIEVWNEPNIEREWQIGYISPQAYTKLLCASYNAIKAANPGTAVISAAPSPTGWFGGACTPNGCDDAPWMAGLRDAGAANCMDYLGAHHNGGATSPSARIGHPADPGSTHHSWFFLPQTELYYNTFGGTRKLFYTEMGYASQEGVPPFSAQFAWASGTDNAEQAAWLAEAVSLSAGMVRCIIIWNIDFVRYGDDPQDGFAIIRPDGSCPACESLHNVMGVP